MLQPFAALARNQPLVRSSLVLALQVAGLALTYAVEVVLARLLGPGDYGSYRYLVAAIAVLATLAGLGLPVLALRLIPVYLEQRREDLLHGFLRSSLLLTIAAAIPAAAAGTAAIHLLRLPGDHLDVLFAVLLAGTVAMAWMNLETEKCFAVARPALALLPSRTLRPLVLLGLVLLASRFDLHLATVLGAFVASLLIAAAVQRAALAPRLPSAATAAKTEVGAWMKVALRLLFPAAASVVLLHIDLLILGRFVGRAETGTYGAAQRVASLVGLFLVSCSSVAAPMLARLWEQRKYDDLQRLFRSLGRWAFWPALGLAVVLVPAAPWVMRVFGPEYAGGALPLVILAFGNALYCAAGLSQALLQMTGKEGAVMTAYAAAVGADLVLGLALAPAFGSVGAAIAAACAIALCSLLLRRAAGRSLRQARAGTASR